MACGYTFKGEVTPYTYKQLVEYFTKNVKDFDDDIVYSKTTVQEEVFGKLLSGKLEAKETVTLFGDTDFAGIAKYTSQTFIDSNSFTINGQRPILRQNDEDYLENLKLSFIDEGNSEVQAEILAKNHRINEKSIGEDARTLHKLVNSFNWNNADVLEWIEHCKGTKFESLAVLIFDQIESGDKSLRKIMYSRHKLNDKSAKIITGINLKANIDVLGEDISGHFDNIVIDKNGTLHIYNYVLTSTPVSEWKAVKEEKYKYKMALLKLILAANGYDVRFAELHIVPVRVKYDENYNEVLEIIFHNTDNIEYTVKDGKYVFKKYDDAAQYFIKAPTKLNKILSPQINSINSKLSILFPDRNIKYDGISKTADEWIRQNYNSRVLLRIKNSDDPRYSYEVYFDDEYKNPIKIEAEFGEHPYKNEKLKEIVELHIEEIQKDSPIVMLKILRTIENSRTRGYSTFGTLSGKAFGYSGAHLGTVLNKYFKFTLINGRKCYDWEFLEDDVLSDAGILVFKNVLTKLVDVISISSYNLNSQLKFKGRTNIMGSWCPDNTSAGKLVEYPATFANIEAVKAITILNEVLPNFTNQDLKLGLLIVVSPMQYGQTKYFDIGLFHRDCFLECVKVVKRNNPTFEFLNNFGKLLSINPLTLVKLLIVSICDTNNDVFSTSDKLFITDLGFLNIENAETKSVKASLIQEMMSNLTKLYSGILGHTDLKRIVEQAKSGFGQERAICNLYIALSKALIYYSEIPVLEERYLSKFDKDFFILSRVPNKTYRGITTLFTSTINDIASLVQTMYSPIASYMNEYLTSKGYSQTKNSILGNQASYFENLYKRNQNNELIMEFRNPYLNSDEFGTLDNAERKFLKKVLFTLAKLRCKDKSITFNFTGVDDPKLLTFIELNQWYFNVPLMKASSASTLLKGIGALINEWKRKCTTLLKDGKTRFEEFVNGNEVEDISINEKGFSELNLINPFNKGESETSREAYLANHTLDYFEYDLSTILGHFVTEHIKCRELNKTLLTTKAVMLLLELLGLDLSDSNGVKLTIDLINDHIKRNVFNLSIMEPNELKVIGWLLPFRKLVSDAFIAGNIISMFRDTFEGVWLNMARTLNHFLTDLTAKSISTAYKEVVIGALSNITSIHKVDLLCKLYRLSNMDVYKIADSVASSKSGIFNVENWMYATLRAPDFLNRMVLFTARCILDGVWEAYNVEDGQLIYNPKRDKRFEAYFTRQPEDPEYIKAKTAYFNAIRLYNLEHPNNQLSYTDLLPEAYSKQQIENLRNLSNSIYGAYDQSMRARYEWMALGWAFGTFSTWMNGIVANYMSKPGIYYDGDMTLEQDTDDSGNLLWIKPDGTEVAEITNEDGTVTYLDINSGKLISKDDSWVPAMKHVPMVVQGIYYTLKDTFKALKSGNFKEEIWLDPMERRNLMKGLTDLLMWCLFFFLFKLAISPAYKDYKKEMKNNPAIANAFVEVLYKSTSRSYDGFGGVLNVILYLGENTNPPVYSLPIKLATDTSKVVFGDKTVMLMLHSNIAIFHSFQDTYKAQLKK